MHAFVKATFAAARQTLRKARQAQRDADACARSYWAAGADGERARRFWPGFVAKRRALIEMALRLRLQAKELLRQLPISEPPPSAV